MATTDNVLQFLRQQGFLPEIDEDNGNILFKYQMANFLYVNNDDDDDFFQLLMPGIYDVTDENREMVFEAANNTSHSIKVVKACIINDSVRLFFENLLDSSPEIADIMPRALQILQAARQHFYEALSE